MSLVGTSGAPARLSEEGRPWWREPFRVFQTNLREVDAGLDVERTLDAIERHGSDVWLLNGGGIMSFYPTDLPFQSRNPHLADRASGDLLGDAVEAAHRRGIRVVARMDFSKVAPRVADAHPDWLYVDPRGERQVYHGLSSTCPAAGYYQEAAFAALEEVAGRYPVDGFFFNWFGFNELDYSGQYRGVSQNAESRRRFAEWSGGAELPTGPESPGYLEWQRFAASVIDDLTARFRAHISGLLPGAAFIRGAGSDVIFHEANNGLGRELWPFATGESISAVRSADRSRPVFVNSVAFVDMPYRLAAEEPAHFEQYIAQTLARGGNPSVYIMGVPGDIDYPDVDEVAPLFHFHRDNADVYRDAVPAADVALVRPDPLRTEPDAFVHARDEFRGAYRALQQRHIPFDVVRFADVAAPGTLRPYRALVVPDCGAFDDTVAEALDDFAARGGTLVLTGSSGVAGRALRAAPVASYGDLVEDRDLYALYAAGQAGDGAHPRHPVVPIYGSYRSIVLADGAAVLHAIVPPAPYGPPEKAHGNRMSTAPATAARRLDGGGAVVVIPWTIGRTFHELGLSVARDLLVDTVVGASKTGLDFSLPPQIEVTLQRTGDDLLVHLINVSGVQGNGITTPVAVRGGSLRSMAPLSATDLRSGRSLTTERHPEGGFVVGLPDLGALSVVLLTFHTPTRTPRSAP